MTIDLTHTGLLAAINASDEVPPEVLEAARGVYAAAEAVNRQDHGNPFADLAETDADVYEAAVRKRVTLHAIAAVLSGGTADNELLAGRPLWSLPGSGVSS